MIKVGDVIKIGEYEGKVSKMDGGYYLEVPIFSNRLIYEQFLTKEELLSKCNLRDVGMFPEADTLEDLQDAIDFLKGFETTLTVVGEPKMDKLLIKRQSLVSILGTADCSEFDDHIKSLLIE